MGILHWSLIIYYFSVWLLVMYVLLVLWVLVKNWDLFDVGFSC